MTAPITPERLRELRGLLERAKTCSSEMDWLNAQADLNAAARNTLPALLDAVEESEAALQLQRDALQSVIDENNGLAAQLADARAKLEGLRGALKDIKERESGCGCLTERCMGTCVYGLAKSALASLAPAPPKETP